ncbi:amidohydrolase [Halobacillus fulvus]|nr:amidohydrolase [Halobacillus fulvus]
MIMENVRLYRPYIPEQDNELYTVYLEGQYIESIHKGPYHGTNQTIDVQGKVLAPSFNDSHMHLLRFGLLKKELDLTEATSWSEMKELVENHYDRMEEGDWIFGKGFDDSKFEDLDHPLTAEDLHEIQVNAYIYFMHEDGHECVISQKAFELLEQEEDFKKEPDEFKETDEHGEWTGRFKDTAVHYIKHHFWGRSVEDAKEALLAGLPYLSKHGITSVHTDDINFIGAYDKLWKAYTELEREGRLPIDVHLHHYIFNIYDLQQYLKNNRNRTGDGTDQVKVGAIKIFLDGTQRLHTAAMRNPYPDQPSKQGTLIYDQEQLNEMVRLAAQNDMQVAMHAIGDKAVEQAINALEQKVAETDRLRHRIIHAQTLGPDLIDRLRKLKPYIESQPSFLLGEWSQKGKWTPADLLPYCDAFHSLVHAHVPVTLSSDLPIGALNPFVSIFTAINRTDMKGNPEGGWMPQEKLSMEESYKGFTMVPAELEYQEKKKGRIEAGYQADFVLLSEYPNEVDASNVHKIQVEETWFRGKQVYKR